MKIFIKIGLLVFSTIFCNIFGQDTEKKVDAKIESNFVEGTVQLKSKATNETDEYLSLNYLFVSIKRGEKGNLSNNKQSGKFTLGPKETKSLSQSGINLQKNDALKVYLYIKNDEDQKLVAKDSLIINANSFAENTLQTEQKQIFELKGLSIDDTKTKIGRDFYDYFYLEYSKLPEIEKTTVTVSELPTMGRSSQISISTDDKVVYSFLSNPSEDYLLEQAKMTIKLLTKYAQTKSLLQNEFQY